MKVFQIVNDAIVDGVYATPEKAGARLVQILLDKNCPRALLNWLRVDVLEVK